MLCSSRPQELGICSSGAVAQFSTRDLGDVMESGQAGSRAAAWIKLAQAMSIVDREPLPVEERAAIHYARGVLRLADEEWASGCAQAGTLGLHEAVESVLAEPEPYRDAVFRGMLFVAWSDEVIRDEEKGLLAALASRWGLDERRIETECVTARQLARTLVDGGDDAS